MATRYRSARLAKAKQRLVAPEAGMQKARPFEKAGPWGEEGELSIGASVRDVHVCRVYARAFHRGALYVLYLALPVWLVVRQ